MEFSVDSNIHYTYNPAQKNADTWPFIAEHYLILNVAIQGSISPSFTQSALEIDYIRVYQDRSTGIPSTNYSINQSVYPNPVDNHLTIQVDNISEGFLPIQIFGADGKVVLTNTYAVNQNRVYMDDLAALQQGVYVLTYSVDGTLVRYRFVKN
jgi:hypothetical protein